MLEMNLEGWDELDHVKQFKLLILFIVKANKKTGLGSVINMHEYMFSV